MIFFTAVYGGVFPDESEAAFASRVSGYSIGCTIAFSYSFFLCTTTKLIILMVLLLIGMGGYIAVVIIKSRLKAKSKSEIKTTVVSL